MLLPTSVVFKASAVAIMLLTPLALMTWRKRSTARGLYAMVSSCFNAAGMVRGLLQKPRFSQPIVEYRVLQEASPIIAAHGTQARHESAYAP